MTIKNKIFFEQRVIFDILMEPSAVPVACGQTTNFSWSGTMFSTLRGNKSFESKIISSLSLNTLTHLDTFSNFISVTMLHVLAFNHASSDAHP